MKKIVVSSILICLSFFTLTAQSDIDAFRFSQMNYQGTARFMGAGGAFGAVGAEYSALAINPASIGIYKKSEISFTPVVVSFFKTKSDYEGKSSNSLSTNYSLTNFGAVFVIPMTDGNPWKGVQIGAGYNRINDFNNSFRIEGVGHSSISHEFADMANGTHFSRLTGDAGLAFNTWAIDTMFGSPNRYQSLSTANELSQKQYVERRGGIDEMNFSVGGNYDDMLYIGATIGVPFIKYRETVNYEESNIDENPYDMTSLERKTNLNVNGTGINLKLGFIYQPADFFRIGAAFHTPTYYSLRENYKAQMRTIFADGFDSGIEGYENEYSYRLVTPLRVTGNLAFLIKKRAFISADYEFTNYGMAKLYASDYNFDEENANVSDKYGATHTVRVGAELYLTKSFLFRIGYNFQSNPYKNEINNTSSHLAAVGLGFRTQNFFIDLAYNLKLSKEDHWMYSPEYVTISNNSYNTNLFAVTVGCKF